MSVVVREGSKGCLRSVLIQLIAIVVVLPLGCLLVGVPFWLVTEYDLNIVWMIIPALLFLFILFGGGFGGLAFVIMRRRRRLDSVAVPLGLEGSRYQLYFRKYLGSLQSREVGLFFYRGPTMEVEVGTGLRTRLGISEGAASRFSGMLNRQPLSLEGLGMGDLTVYALDENWARVFLAQRGVPFHLQQLMALTRAFTIRHVILQPGWLRVYARGSRNVLDFNFDVTAEQAQGIFEHLLALAEIAESAPPPQVTDELTKLERTAQSLRGRNPA
jgi:hypothetical protein